MLMFLFLLVHATAALSLGYCLILLVLYSMLWLPSYSGLLVLLSSLMLFCWGKVG